LGFLALGGVLGLLAPRVEEEEVELGILVILSPRVEEEEAALVLDLDASVAVPRQDKII
jgi:hypothetical protein